MTKKEKAELDFKRELASNNIKRNLIYALNSFNQEDKTSRSNYLMAIGISSKRGTLTYYYGTDPVAEEVRKRSKELKHKKKVYKTLMSNRPATIEVWGNDLIVTYYDKKGSLVSFTLANLKDISELTQELKDAGYSHK